ncbi:FAD-dependent oxidoreductase [Nocardia vaccinii]|uniref:FAD-dependent oxidoreductase n=1 Tax=Nocardia vaccinii TaxID=1822 RepID=UPI0008357245|nr:FAD-dependent oxidoreductase [Nocardia vaccinii]
MSHVILGHCCKDASCVRVCPQNCIHPLPGEAGFDTTETLHIDPRSCIDCAACTQVCPASAIKPEFLLTDLERPCAARNREYFDRTGTAVRPAPAPPRFASPLGTPFDRPRVAVIGSGPAAMYTVRELLRRSGSVRVTVFEQDSEIGGLLRRGVSIDHPEIRGMIHLFEVPFADDRVTVVRNTKVGVDISIAAIRSDSDAVVLACGASQPRTIGPPGPRLPGVHQAVDLLIAANTETPVMRPTEALGPRCVIVGAGNVAFDVVRWIATRYNTDTPGPKVTEVTVLSRATPDRPAFTASAFDELLGLRGVEVVVDHIGTGPAAPPDSSLLHQISARPAAGLGPASEGTVRVVLSFGRDVTQIHASPPGRSTVVTASEHSFHADSVICAAGFRAQAIEGIPLSDNGVVPNRHGRVLRAETGEPIEGLYVVGWAKRGATGGIGDSRNCAAETVECLAQDLGR